MSDRWKKMPFNIVATVNFKCAMNTLSSPKKLIENKTQSYASNSFFLLVDDGNKKPSSFSRSSCGTTGLVGVAVFFCMIHQVVLRGSATHIQSDFCHLRKNIKKIRYLSEFEFLLVIPEMNTEQKSSRLNIEPVLRTATFSC
jgi:hypothetical protein